MATTKPGATSGSRVSTATNKDISQTSLFPSSPVDGGEPQGYVAVPCTVDISRGVNVNDIQMAIHFPKGIGDPAIVKSDGTVDVTDVGKVRRSLNKPVAIKAQVDGASGTFTKADFTGTSTPAAGDKALYSTFTAPTAKKVPWKVDITYLTQISAVVVGTAGKIGPERVFAKGAALDVTKLVAEIDFIDKTAAGFDSADLKAPKDIFAGDTVTILAGRMGTLHGEVYPFVSDNDWTAQDKYGSYQQFDADVNPDVQTTGAGIGKDAFIYGAAIPGSRFLLEKADYAKASANAAGLVAAGILPKNTVQKADGTWDYSQVPTWLKGEEITLVEIDNGVATGTTKTFSANSTGWVAASTTVPSVITDVTPKYADGKPDVSAAWVVSQTPVGGTEATAAAFSLNDLNRMGGIDFEVVCIDNKGTKFVLDPDRIWPARAFCTVASSVVPAGVKYLVAGVAAVPGGGSGGGAGTAAVPEHWEVGDGTKSVTAAYWNGSRFAPGIAPLVLPNSTDTFTKVN